MNLQSLFSMLASGLTRCIGLLLVLFVPATWNYSYSANPDAAGYVIKDSGVTARSLIKRGANVNSANREGWTPLMAAAARGSDAMVNGLIAAGPQVAARHNSGQTAADVALARKKTGTARILEQAQHRK